MCDEITFQRQTFTVQDFHLLLVINEHKSTQSCTCLCTLSSFLELYETTLLSKGSKELPVHKEVKIEGQPQSGSPSYCSYSCAPYLYMPLKKTAHWKFIELALNITSHRAPWRAFTPALDSNIVKIHLALLLHTPTKGCPMATYTIKVRLSGTEKFLFKQCAAESKCLENVHFLSLASTHLAQLGCVKTLHTSK